VDCCPCVPADVWRVDRGCGGDGGGWLSPFARSRSLAIIACFSTVSVSQSLGSKKGRVLDHQPTSLQRFNCFNECWPSANQPTVFLFFWGFLIERETAFELAQHCAAILSTIRVIALSC
jgi:hypothetical protein